MQSGWRVGSLFGIPLQINPSWIYVVLFVTGINGLYWHHLYPQWGAFLPWVVGLLLALLLFTSVLLHELGHSLVARQQGIAVSSITLFLFGGVAAIDQEAKTPGKAFQVAIAGPVVSITLFGLLTLLAYALPATSAIAVLTQDLARVNLILALFNLVPGLPLDGGQVLKAAIWQATGDRFKATRWAARTGQVLGWFAISLGILALFLPGASTGGIWLALIGWFIVRNAGLYSRLNVLQEVILQAKASDAMTREYRVLDAAMSIRQFADEYVLQAPPLPPAYFVAADGRYRGLVSSQDLSQVERSQWETETLQAIVHPLDQLVTVQEQTPLMEVINCMEAHQLNRITVLSPAGAVAGVIDQGDIVRAVTAKLNIQLSEAAVRQIKEQGAYPPVLPLPSIAKVTAASLAPEPHSSQP